MTPTSLLQEVMQWHSDPESPNYNECDKEPCQWCVNAKVAIAVDDSRVRELEDTLNQIFHYTNCTTGQMELIEKVLPQKVEDWVCPTCNTKNPARYLNCDNACCQE